MELDELDEMTEFGTIRQFINQGIGMVLVEPTDPLQLFDIECQVTFKGGKTVVGFIFELVGPITAPLYSVQLYPEYVDEIKAKFAATREAPSEADGPMSTQLVTFFKEELHDSLCFVVKRTMKLINSRLDDLIKMKGCDASNMFDEEVMKTE